MPAPRKISDEQRARLLAVIQMRQRIPSDQQLADECGVSRSAIRQAMTLMLSKLQHDLDTNTKDSGIIAE